MYKDLNRPLCRQKVGCMFNNVLQVMQPIGGFLSFCGNIFPDCGSVHVVRPSESL